MICKHLTYYTLLMRCSFNPLFRFPFRAILNMTCTYLSMCVCMYVCVRVCVCVCESACCYFYSAKLVLFHIARSADKQDFYLHNIAFAWITVHANTLPPKHNTDDNDTAEHAHEMLHNNVRNVKPKLRTAGDHC